MKFLIQLRHGRLPYDFCYEMQHAEEYAKWRGEPFDIVQYLETDSDKRNFSPEEFKKYPGYIPIGSVEFVNDYYWTFFYAKDGTALKPLNVPQELIPYAGREILNIDSDNVEYHLSDCMNRTMYRKSNKKLKDQANGFVKVKSAADILDMQVSPDIEERSPIMSEWRVFVYHDKIQHMSNYSGDCFAYPDRDRILDMVNAYKPNAPVAYTLDVFVTPTLTLTGNETANTFVMECHRFFSCGLYGFSDYAVLPYMFSQEWFEMINMD